MTVNELIEILSQCDGNAKVEIRVDSAIDAAWSSEGVAVKVQEGTQIVTVEAYVESDDGNAFFPGVSDCDFDEEHEDDQD
jgi:copper chaperone CopZ